MSDRDTIEILMVEDNASDVELMKIAMATFPFSVHLTICDDGEEAWHYLNNPKTHVCGRPPDMVFLDLNLPRKTGIEILEQMKTDESFKNIPVAVMTTAPQEKDIARVSEFPKTRIFLKPFRFSDYATLLKSIADFWLLCRP